MGYEPTRVKRVKLSSGKIVRVFAVSDNDYVIERNKYPMSRHEADYESIHKFNRELTRDMSIDFEKIRDCITMSHNDVGCKHFCVGCRSKCDLWEKE